MEVLNKLMPLLMALVMSVNLSGCGNRAGAESGQSETTVSTSTVTDENGNKVATAADFSKVTICGTEFTMPCKASDFKGDFYVDTKSEKWNQFSICYKDTPVAILKFDEDIEKVNLKKHNPNSIFLFEDSHYNINGFTDDMDSNQLIQYFGEPNECLTDDNGIITSAKYNINDNATKIETVIISKIKPVSEDSRYHVFISFRGDK